ncbi:hypothetical protein [Pseudomaricurvus sp. HS19]|uniref:hypothetical protein n=1 Tax=Pseudomaricurvus sp. HS19 TaxID=2692626 RepID=UPI00136EABCB|nr:hypothetical protein [Pseudomaricurvus sp. HS19]MYM62786.1 hypothetical protein [Pseudomaricurvus sp. HS19]
MTKIPAKLGLLTAAMLAVGSVHAAEVRINGFASIAGGQTLSEGTTTSSHLTSGPTDLPGEGKATYVADPVTDGVYDDQWSFNPDSNYGIQITADLGEGLSATGQITGNGGEDFEAVVSWAYISYEFNENWTVMAGRQRLPLFYYSDFIDVGYAYHWIRPPQELVATDGDTFNGVKVRYSNYIGSWDWSAEAYYGNSEEDVASGQITTTIKSEDQHGVVLRASNSWLILRATYSGADSVTELDQLLGANYPNIIPDGQGSEENPLKYTFMGLAAQMNFGNVFIVSEYTHGKPDNPAFPTNGFSGRDEAEGWYVSTGIRLGNFTPHITYSENTVDYVQTGPVVTPGQLSDVTAEFQSKREAITAGVRWDFHPSAALKVEYTTRTDKSDDFYKGNGNFYEGAGMWGYGETGEVDVVAVALDVIF